MKILVFGNDSRSRKDMAEKLGEAYGLPVFDKGVAESQGAARMKDGVYLSDEGIRGIPTKSLYDAVVECHPTAENNIVSKYKMAHSRIYGVYKVDENGEITDTPAVGVRGRVLEDLKRNYALVLVKRMNKAAGKEVVRANIMKEYLGE